MANTRKIERYGNQKPRIDIYANGDITLANKTIELIEYYGMGLFEWQKAVLRRWMATNPDGTWANPEAGLVVPRQNGKTEVIIARIIGGLVFCNERLIYTAHAVSTVSEIKRRVQTFFYKADDEVRNMLTAEFDGEPRTLDYIELQGEGREVGGRCVFRTRTRTSGLGFSNDTLILDEDQEETDGQSEAMLPTISAGPAHNHQLIRAGTPPTIGSSGTVFVRTRNNVLEAKTLTYCWQEWSAETLTDPSDVDMWYETNPSLGYVLMESAIKNEAVSLSIDSFNKMRLAWFAGVETQRAISDDDWNALILKPVVLPPEPNLVYAVKFAPDRSAVSLCVGVVMPSGKIHVEVMERKPMSAGTGWLVKWLLARWRKCNKIIIDGAAGSQILVEELVRAEPKLSKKILTPNVKEAGAAYGMFADAITHQELTHYDQPVLNMAVRTAKKRDIGRDGMFGYATMNPDIQSDALEAAAFAYYGAIRFRKNTTATVQKVGFTG